MLEASKNTNDEKKILYSEIKINRLILSQN